MSDAYAMLINGELVEGVSTFPVLNPATEEVLAYCPKADIDQLNQAVAAAKAAFPAWAAKSQDERASVLLAIADALQNRAGEFARVLTAEQGKPLPQAEQEIGGSVAILRDYAAMRITDKLIRDTPDQHIIETRTPLGVCAAITPWNFPLILLMNKFGPAMLTGNTMVAKPAPTTPLTSLLFAELAAEFLPSGVFNIICDENELGEALCTHPDIAKIGFTGSTATGKKVMASAATGVKRVTLELGGNDAAIVLDDVPANLAAKKVFSTAMANAGQVCIAAKRAFVPESLYDDFCTEIAELANAAVVDDGAKQGTNIGPVQNRAQYERVAALLEQAKEQGRVIAGGNIPDRPGYFIPPTIIADLGDDAPLVCEEQFGPVLPVLKYRDIEEVIERANASDYGLGGTIWGKDVERATTIARRIDSGTLWINHAMAIETTIPFRGAKQSGFGGEGGEEGLFSYTQPHIINARPLK